MFISSINYKEMVTAVAQEAGELLMAVAFWGRGAEAVVHPRTAGAVKLICNLKSGATNPNTIEALRNIKGVTIRQHDYLHAKVIIGTNTAVIGSANLSGNGLNLENNELQGWEEAGFLTHDSTQLAAMRKWFADIWNESQDIGDQDIEDARIIWERRRHTRIINTCPPNGNFTLADLIHAEILDRRLYLAIYTESLSDEAISAYHQNEKELIGQPGAPLAEHSPMYVYEDWDTLPRDAQLIDIYYGPRGGLRCYGVFTRIYDIEFEYSDGSPGHLAVCRRETHLMGYPFRGREATQFANSLRPHIENIWNSPSAIGDETGKFILLADVVQLINQRN